MPCELPLMDACSRALVQSSLTMLSELWVGNRTGMDAPAGVNLQGFCLAAVSPMLPGTPGQPMVIAQGRGYPCFVRTTARAMVEHKQWEVAGGHSGGCCTVAEGRVLPGTGWRWCGCTWCWSLCSTFLLWPGCKYALHLYYLDWKVTRGGAVSQENRFESKWWKKEPGQPKDSTLGGTSLGA